MNADARRIDAHLHLWDRAVSEYAWLGPQLGVVNDDWSPTQAAAELVQAGMSGAVLVQAEDSRADTQYLLDVAVSQAWALGVVGWVQLDDPDKAAQDLDRWLQNPAFCGVRHLINDDSRSNFLDLPAVRASLAALARRGIPFDVHDAWPRHTGQATRLARDLPELILVFDHLGKPPRNGEELDAWQGHMEAAAALPNTVAKISGLHFRGAPLPADILRRVWDTALERFGPGRLMYGGDWPMTMAMGGYQPSWVGISQLIDDLTKSEQANILSGTATRIYRLSEPEIPRS